MSYHLYLRIIILSHDFDLLKSKPWIIDSIKSLIMVIIMAQIIAQKLSFYYFATNIRRYWIINDELD